MDLIDDLRAALGGDRVHARAIDRHARARDASHYLLVPQVAAVAEDAGAVARALGVASRHGTPVTFRSGGTSLSGQASGSGLLLDTRRGFRRVEVLDAGARVRVQPGATVRAVNARLAPFGRALGPDPASEAACTIGGVIANNSSGMAAGVEHNSYRTLESLTVVLASGTVVDTAAPGARDRLRSAEPGLVAALERLRDRVRADPASVAEIRERFAMKNTMGYSLDAFCDFTDPLDLLVHLLVGSEGTLGFVAEAVFRTVSVQPCAATGLLVLDSVERAAAALPALVGTGAAALELMDATSLRVARRDPGAPAAVRGFDIDQHAAILLEYRADDESSLADRVAAAGVVLDALPAVVPVELTRVPAERAALWSVRKGLYAAVAGARPPGTTALLEDVVVPVERLADTCRELAALLSAHGYVDPVIFGHAKDGNLHFMVTEEIGDATDPAALDRLAAFTEDLVTLVLRQGGNLKAEHGTGRAMAPFVERQYSAGLVAVLREVKRAFDPAGILNPGVVLTDDPRAHLADLKPVDHVDAEVDRCVECGYCEPVCPSRDLTLTPRQRIVVRRAQARAAAEGDEALAAELAEQFRYDGVDTCAADGMCATACPVRIDTGALVKRLRAEDRGGVGRRAWRTAAAHWDTVTAAAGTGLDAAARVPAPAVQAPNRAARSLLGDDVVPLWSPDLPGGGRGRSGTRGGTGVPGDVAGVFLPSCQGAMFAPGEPGGDGVQAATAALCEAAGVGLVVPAGLDGLCCGTPWSSKGYADGHAVMAERVLAAVDAARAAARERTGADVPVVVDASSCSEGVAAIMAAARAAGDPRAADVVDALSFVVRQVLPRLTVDDGRRVASVTLHPTCSSVKAGTDGDLHTLARAVARTVHVPVDWACCGFAGDRGMLHPELTAAATAAEAAEVVQLAAAEHASSNRACEIAMTRATGRTYRHLLEVAAQVVGPRARR
ncbi:D-lactate dehydrogenase [Isoptericola sp. CG 20/1183]|uniref:D-lactate dehydrogenase (cytochrome) n=1 Tax=Isoptericola halotolerans TaxID=300560 RepID=A0ABX5EDV7_9MICO|nr:MULTISPECIES: FAD-binding and (Fe-S)-binding domain-containing protein [Isoptericola]PRZ06893.1 D-lactate dehydrogenase [Isoptericola halotolerans]PRZ07435.1 D-lactate dehydrogenase [Isoptericola sp. CG 20/1183]